MILSPRALAITGSLALVLSGVAAPATAATTTTFPLHGTKMANLAHGIAMVTASRAGEYRVVITIANMPVPSTLHTTPIRHAYVAWAFNAGAMRAPSSHTQQRGTPRNPAAMLGTLVPIRLHATGAGRYTGSSMVMMKQVPGIIVTAEVSATVHKPAMPFWGVLVGSMTPQKG